MENPRIYVASLSDYNNGRLEGKWFDFDDYSDASELMGAITEMLDEITKKYNDGEEREEWAVHDYEYIPSTLATEYMGERDFQTIYDIIEASEEYGIPTEVLMERVGDTGSDDYENIAESLMFVVDGNDESDIVEEIEEQLGELGFDFWQNHIYIDDVTKRVMYGEDVDRYREYIQHDNPEMDENEVERLAEEQADDEESRRNDDLIGYLEEMGYTDIPRWVSKDYVSAWKNALSYDYDIISYDGKMYVFSINYSQGGNVKYEGGGMINGKYLDSLSETSKNKILQNIANHYGISLSEAEEEVRDEDAEMLYEYIANNPTLRMDVYTAIRNKRYDEGGNVQRLSDEDVARIQQAIEQSRHKGIIEKYQENSPFSQQNQISPKEAMAFVKENPEVLKLLLLKKGGKIDSENYQMLRGKIKEVEHHAKELKSITNRKKEVPAWVLSKSTRASTDLSDITHYMDSAKFDKGGNISYKEQQINEVSSWDNDEIANYLGISISQVAKDRNRYVREAQSVLMLSSYGNGGGITDYDWANEFRKGKPNKMVVVYRIDGNLMISEVEVEARNETEAYYNTRKQFEAQNPNAKIEKVYTLGDVEAGKFEEGGGINDELPYPYQMQWEKLLNDFGKDKVMRMFPSGANGYYTSRTKGNYSDDAIRQSLKSMFNEGGNVNGLSDLIKG